MTVFGLPDVPEVNMCVSSTSGPVGAASLHSGAAAAAVARSMPPNGDAAPASSPATSLTRPSGSLANWSPSVTTTRTPP